jgi:histidinol-phosphate aminotransferase
MASINRREWMLLGAASAAAATGISTTSFAVLAPATAAAQLHANENPYGPSRAARRAMAAEVASANRYAIPQDGLAARIAEREGLTAAHVALGAGSTEALHMAALAFGLGDGEVLTADPTFGLLARAVERAGERVRRVPLDASHGHDLDEMARQTTAATRLVYVCNPNNPTGTVVAPSRLRDFCEEVSRRATVLVDEAYVEYLDPAERASMVDLVRAGANVVVVRTFSKIYGLAGARVGYALARPDLVERLRRFQVGNLNRFGYAAALASLDDAAFVAESRRLTAEARAFTASALEALGVPCAASHTNFLYANVGAARRGLPAALARRQMRVNWNGEPLAGDWMRVTMGTMDEMRRFAAAMRESVRG